MMAARRTKTPWVNAKPGGPDLIARPSVLGDILGPKQRLFSNKPLH